MIEFLFGNCDLILIFRFPREIKKLPINPVFSNSFNFSAKVNHRLFLNFKQLKDYLFLNLKFGR